MSVQENSLKFPKLSKYGTSLISNPRDEMSRFVTVVSDSIEKHCRLTMLHNNMDISCLMVYAQYVKENRLRRKSGEVKRTSSNDGCSSKGKFEIKDRKRGRRGLSTKACLML